MSRLSSMTLPSGTRLDLARNGLTGEDGKKEDGEADGKRPAPDAEQLLQLKRHDLGAIGKELLDRRSYVLGLRQSELLLRHMHDDLERPVARQLPRPTDDEFLGVLVEIFLAERERVETMKELGKLARREFRSNSALAAALARSCQTVTTSPRLPATEMGPAEGTPIGGPATVRHVRLQASRCTGKTNG